MWFGGAQIFRIDLRQVHRRDRERLAVDRRIERRVLASDCGIDGAREFPRPHRRYGCVLIRVGSDFPRRKRIARLEGLALPVRCARRHRFHYRRRAISATRPGIALVAALCPGLFAARSVADRAADRDRDGDGESAMTQHLPVLPCGCRFHFAEQILWSDLAEFATPLRASVSSSRMAVGECACAHVSFSLTHSRPIGAGINRQTLAGDLIWGTGGAAHPDTSTEG